MRRGLWLDQLSEELRENIAARVCQGAQNLDALHLACVSQAQRRAVVAALGYTLRFGLLDKYRLEKWVAVFGDSLQHLSSLRDLDDCADNLCCVTSAFSSPSLRSVEVSDHPEYLDAITRWSPPRVTIVLLGYSTKNQLVRSVLNHTAQELRLKFVNHGALRHSGLDQWLALYWPQSMALAMCQSLRSLDVYCSPIRIERPGSIWAIIIQLTSLRHLGVYGCEGAFEDVSKTTVLFLSYLQSVTLLGAISAHALAIRIGPAVTNLEFRQVRMSKDDLLPLVTFHRLKRLVVVIEEEAENVLPQVVKVLPKLEILELEWEWKLYIPFPEAQCGELLEVVQAAPKLTELCLMGVTIRFTELNAILKSLGARLRRFETGIGQQDESPLNRLILLVQAAMNYNPELRTFLSRVPTEGTYRYEEERDLVPQLQVQATCMLQQLQARAPLLSTTDLERYICKSYRDK